MEIFDKNKMNMIIQSLKYSDPEADKIKDQLLREYLTYVNLLNLLENKAIIENDLSKIENIFYSRYYWFNKYKNRYFKLYGNDEGLEQQGFKILSNFSELFPDKINWDIIEQIERHSIEKD